MNTTIETDRKTTGFYVAALLAVNFVIGYISHHYFREELLDYSSLGFWVGMSNFVIITGIVLH